MAETDALTTLTLLESRLHRLEFLLSSSTDTNGVPKVTTPPVKNNDTIASRLNSLEDDLTKLAANSTLVQDMLRLQARFPDLLGASSATMKPNDTDQSTEASVVLAHASSFPETASRLSSLKDLSIPPAEASSKLVELQPRLEKVKEVQDRQLRQVTELRERSARIVERWISQGVVGSGEAWAEMEACVRELEKGVRKVERRNTEGNS